MFYAHETGWSMTDAIEQAARSAPGTNWATLTSAELRNRCRGATAVDIVLCPADLEGVKQWVARQPLIRAGARAEFSSPTEIVWVAHEGPIASAGCAQARTVLAFHSRPPLPHEPLPGWLDLLTFATHFARRWARRCRLDADDLTQETVMRMWQRRTQPLAVLNWEALVTRIVQSAATRIGVLHKRVQFNSSGIELVADVEHESSAERVDLLLLCGNDRERAIVDLFLAGIQSVRAIARETGRTPCRVRSTLRSMARRLATPGKLIAS